MEIQQLIGTRIKQLRAEKNMSQEELALISGLNQSYLSGVETGKRNVSILNIARIAQALNVSIYQFFNHNTFD